MPQEIKLYKKYVEMVVAGTKKATIRRGVKYYQLGDADLVETENPERRIPIWITDISLQNLNTLIDSDAFDDGFRGLGALKLALRDLYPGLDEYESLTVVKFERKIDQK